jgi:hypothetical protein
MNKLTEKGKAYRQMVGSKVQGTNALNSYFPVVLGKRRAADDDSWKPSRIPPLRSRARMKRRLMIERSNWVTPSELKACRAF